MPKPIAAPWDRHHAGPRIPLDHPPPTPPPTLGRPPPRDPARGPARGVEDREAPRLEMRRFRTARALIRLAWAELALAGLIAFADWMWVLPAALRAVGLLAMVGVA